MKNINLHIQNLKPKHTHHKAYLSVVAVLVLAIVTAGVLKITNKLPVTEAASATNSSRFGIAMGATGNNVDSPALVRSLGARKMRTTMTWGAEQPNGPNDPIGKYDGMAAAAQKEGVNILGVLAFAPGWAQNSECKKKYANNGEQRQKCEPRSASEYGVWAGKMAARYKKYGINTWEIWNEPNLTAFWKDADGTPNAKHYTEALKSAYSNIKWFNPNATVLIGGLAANGDYTNDPNATQIDARAFLQQMYISGLDNKYDALGYHPYTFAYKTRPDFDEIGSWNSMYKDCGSVKSIRNIMVALGAADKKIWVTEYGFITATAMYNGQPRTFTQDDQVWSMRNAVNLWKTYPWAGNFFYFKHTDDAPVKSGVISVGESYDYFGITQLSSSRASCIGLTPVGSAKKSYCWYKKFLTSPQTGWMALEANGRDTEISGVTAGVCKIPQSSGVFGVKVLVGRTSTNASHSSAHFVRGGVSGNTEAMKTWFNDRLQIHQINYMNSSDKVKANIRMKDGRLLNFGQVASGNTNSDYITTANINSFCD